MTEEMIVLLGYGPVGRALGERLTARGRRWRLAQRSRPADLPASVEFVRADVLDLDSLLAACRGATQIAVTIGFAYDLAVWKDSWPRAMVNLIAAAETTRARMLFFDNLYMYGPQDGPIAETTPFADWGGKPAVRAGITRMWESAVAAGRIRFAALRAPDFYGPGAGNSHLGDLVFGRIASGRPALFAVPVDHPHDFAYVPDCGRAMETLLDAPDDAYGQVWHMPSAPARSLRDLAGLGAAALGLKPKLVSLPLWSLPLLGLTQPALREVHDMRFTWNRPYHVDARKFAARFWSDVTPFETGVPLTARAFAAAAGAATQAAA